jgi:nitrate reductase gamma subunit
MTAHDLLVWVRGPAMQFSLAVFFVGVALRILEMWLLGHSHDLAEPRRGGFWAGWRTVFHRSIPGPGMLQREPLVFLGGYTFHLGFFITLIFFAPHIELFRGVLGIRWPGLPASLIDLIAVVSIAALVALLIHRLVHPVRRFLSNGGDYLSWLVTFLPLLTGYMLAHEALLPYTQMLTVHVLTVELLLIVLPFTKLTHSFTIFLSRWYNGAMAGRKGVAS